MKDEMVRHGLAEVHQGASRLHSILTHSGNVRMAIGDMRNAADRFAAALNRDAFEPQESCDMMNTLFQLNCFFVNSGTGLEQQGEAKMHPLGENWTIEHVECWTSCFNGMATVLEQGGDINAWLAVHPLPPGQPGMAPVTVMNARRARAASLPPAPPPTQPIAPRFTHKFMCKYLSLGLRTAANKHEPMPPLLVELVDGEINYISEDIQTVFVIGDPVMLPGTPCPADEWDQWLADFLRTHPFVGGENLGYRQETCYVIREVERAD